MVHQKFFKKNGACSCPPVIKAPYLENDPHSLSNYTYACFRTNKTGRGLGVTPKMMSKTKFNNLQVYDDKFLPLYYQRISNSCQLIAGKPITDGGDCGTLLSSILLSTPILTSEHILLRQTMNLVSFFPIKDHSKYDKN